MKPARCTIDIPHPNLVIQVTDDGSRTLIDPATDVAYHSGCGAVAETRHVYLRNSSVEDRFINRLPTSVLEIGLGTGLGLLMTLDHARRHAAPLRYTAWEQQWLAADVLEQLDLGRHLHDPSLAEALIDWRRSLEVEVSAGRYQWPLDEHNQVA